MSMKWVAKSPGGELLTSDRDDIATVPGRGEEREAIPEVTPSSLLIEGRIAALGDIAHAAVDDESDARRRWAARVMVAVAGAAFLAGGFQLTHVL